MLLTFLLAAALWNCNCWWNAANIYTFAGQTEYLDFDNLPETNFSCDGKVIGGYYADVETGCQMFHVCTIGQKAEITDIKFLCLNGTVFDQETRVCERLDEVDCSRSESFFDLNLELYGNNGAGYGIAPEEPPEQEPAQCDADEEDCSGTSDYFDEEATTVASIKSSAVATAAVAAVVTTTMPTTTTTTTTTPATTAATSTTAFTRKPVAAAVTSTTKPPPPVVSYPTNSPETIAALIALHNAFQESLKEREQGPGPKGQRYPPPTLLQQPSPKPFTVANFQPPRHFPSKIPQQQLPPPPPQYRLQPQQQQPPQQPVPVLLSSERFGNQNFRHGFRLQNGGPPPAVTTQTSAPRPQTYRQEQHQQQQQQQQYADEYDGSYEDGKYEDADDEDSRRNFARDTSEASVSVSVQVSSSSSKNSAIDRQPQQQRRPQPAAATTSAPQPTPRPQSSTPQSQPTLPPPPTDDAAGDLYEDEYEELEGDEEFFRDVPKLDGNRNRRRRHLGRGRA